MDTGCEQPSDSAMHGVTALSTHAGENGAAGSAVADRRTFSETMQTCLLDTQRQVYRLEAVLHGLHGAATPMTGGTLSEVSRISASNRRLSRQVDEFAVEIYEILAKMNRDAKVPRLYQTR